MQFHKIKRNLLISLVLTVFSCPNLPGQENFKNGFIVDTSGDTTFGLIDYQQWVQNPNKISFKHDSISEAEYLTPLQISEFYVSGEIYFGTIADVELTRNDHGGITYGAKPFLARDTVFLKLEYATESKKLLSNNLGGSTVNYYLWYGDDYELLIYKKYYADDGYGNQVLKENRRYIGQLIYFLRDCEFLSEQIGNIDYNHHDLIKVLSIYRDCVKENEVFRRIEKRKVIDNFGPITGVFMSNIFPDINKGDDLFPEYKAGMFFESILPGQRKMVNLKSEFTISMFSFKRTQYYYNSLGVSTSKREDHFSGMRVNLNALLKRKIVITNFPIYIFAGASVEVLFNRKIFIEKTGYLSSGAISNIMTGNLVKHPVSYSTLVIGVSKKINNFKLDIRYEMAGPFFTLSYDYRNRFGINIGYLF